MKPGFGTAWQGLAGQGGARHGKKGTGSQAALVAKLTQEGLR